MSIANVITAGQCVVTVQQDSGIFRCGVEFTDRWGETGRIDDITTEPEFLKQIIETLTSYDVSALHLRDIVENMVIERYT